MASLHEFVSSALDAGERTALR